jgi:hypothetical protein
MNWNRWLIGIFMVTAIVSATVGVFIGRTFKPDISNNPLLFSGMRPPAKQLDSAFGMVLSKSPAELEQTDIETLYLSCLSSLPGTGKQDLDRARAHFAELAKMVQNETEATSKYQHKTNKDFQDTPEGKASILVNVLRNYEQEAERTMDSSEPENLFLRNPKVSDGEAQLNLALPADVAARLPQLPSRPEDSIPEIQHKVYTLNNPILILVVGRLLGYPLYLAKAPDHLFVRWQSDDGKTEFNIDEFDKYGSIVDDAIRPDSDYERPPEEQVKEGGYFQSLTHAGVTALFLQARGNFMRKQQRGFDAELAYAAAHRFAPDVPIYKENMIELVGEEMQLRDMKWKDMAERNGYYLNLSPPKPDKTIIP